jgi:riboflavin kinase/FMN adenylyltransferase
MYIKIWILGLIIAPKFQNPIFVKEFMTVIDLRTGKETTLPLGARLSCALGNFDGVHVGHKELLVKAAKKEYGTDTSAVWTFRVHPQIILGSSGVKILTSTEQKLEYFAAAGIEYAILEDFEAVSHMPPEDFAIDLLIKKLGVHHAVCGFNFSFGSKAAGNCTLLKEYFGQEGKTVSIISPFKMDGNTVSSSLVRSKIELGDVEFAEKLLGHPFSILLPVTEGRKLGRKMGAPTINQVFPENHAIPKFGVYACRCHVDGRVYMGIANVGIRPTITEQEKIVNCETHILDYSGYLYGKKIRVDFCKFIREERKFPSVEALAEEINKNIEEIREYFAK